jgi:membrane-bound lytic murein transglycosylase D
LNTFKLVFGLILSSTFLCAQTIPKVPDKVEFAGVSIHLSQQGRVRIQQEIERLYKYPRIVQADISALRQLSPLLKPLLAKEKLPDDFRFVALPFDGIDSTGYWALSKKHAQHLDLRVDESIDERYHPLISTEAIVNELGRF